MHQTTSKHRLTLALILLVTLGAYARAFWNDFTYDDRVYVMVPNSDGQPNFMVGDLQTPGRYFTRHYGHGCGHGGRGYRPITVLSFALVHALFEAGGSGPEGSDCSAVPHHVIGVLLHLLGVFLTWRMVAHFTGPGLPALLAAAVFGLHALRSDPVISIVGRAEVLAYVFGAGALLTYVAAHRRGGMRRYLFLALSVLLLFCACGSKESAFAWVVFVPLFMLTLDCHLHPDLSVGQALRRQVPALSAVLVPLVVSLGFYLHLQGLLAAREFEAAATQNPIFAAAWPVRVLTAVMVLGHGLLKVFVPWPLACDHGIGVFPILGSVFDPRFLAALLVLGFVLVLGLRMFRRHPLLFLGMASFLGFSFLTSNIPLPIETIFAERLYYTPAVALSFLVAWGALRPEGRWRSGLVLVVGLWCAAGVFLIYGRCVAWQDNETLHAADAENQPRSLAMRMAVARTLRLRGQAEGWNEALKQEWYENLFKAYQIEPRSPLALNMLAYYHMEFDELEKAEEYIRQALASPLLNPRHDGIKLYWQLSQIAERRGDLALAERRLHDAIAIDRLRVEPRTQLADFLHRHGRQQEGEAILEGLLQEYAENVHVRWILIQLARSRGDAQRVGRLLEEGARVRPDVGGFWLELGLVHLGERRLEAARAMLTRALRGGLRPEERRRCLLPLATCLELLGQKGEAVRILEQVLADPQLTPEGRGRVQQKIEALGGRPR